MQLKNPLGSEVAQGYVTLRAVGHKMASDLLGINAALKSKMSHAGLAAGRAFGTKFADGYRSSMERISGILTGSLIGATAAGAGFVSFGVMLAAQQEAMLQSYETMLQSRERAVKLMAEIKQFAISTPYETKELNQATKMLLALGVPAEEIIGTLRRLGDIASALNLPITELAELFGKMRTQGKLLSNDIYQLGGRGIPIIKELAKQFGVAESEVMELVSSGKVGFSALDKAIKSMTDSGGMFSGMMEKQSQTLNGVMSTVKDQVAEVAMTVGTALMPAVKEMVGGVSEAMPEIQGAAQAVGDAMADAFDTDNLTTFTTALMDSVDALRLMGAYFDEAQLGATRLALIAYKLNGAVQAWRFTGHEDEYQGALTAFREEIKDLATEATMVDPKSGKRVNKTDHLWENFGQRSRDLAEKRRSTPRTVPPWLAEQHKAIADFGKKPGLQLGKMQDALGDFGNKMLAGIGKHVLGRNGEVLAAGAGATVKAMKPAEGLPSGFYGFEELNRKIQETLLEPDAAKLTAKNTTKQLTISQKANELLEGVKDSMKNFTIFTK